MENQKLFQENQSSGTPGVSNISGAHATSSGYHERDAHGPAGKASLKDVRFLVTAALLTALACAATMAVKIPTPTMGYVHIGDGMVLLSGLVLGPWYGALAGGIGSMLADLLTGYAIWAPGTFVIKAGTALLAGLLFRLLRKTAAKKSVSLGSALAGSLAGEAFMVVGYLFYNVLIISLTNGAFSAASMAAAFAESLAEIPFNAVQGGVGIVIALVLLPILAKIPEIKGYINR